MKLLELGMIVSFGTAAFLFGGVARGADTAASAESAKVLSKLHHSNQMEIAAGKLALEKGQSKDVKSFGKTLVNDHAAADKKVMALAKEEKIDMPASVPMPDTMDNLKGASAAEFDRTFVADMLDDHKKDVAEAKEARDATKDTKLPDDAAVVRTVRSFLKSTEETIGLLEGLQNNAEHAGVDAKVFRQYVGPESARWWAALDRFWAGEIPYVHVE